MRSRILITLIGLLGFSQSQVYYSTLNGLALPAYTGSASSRALGNSDFMINGSSGWILTNPAALTRYSGLQIDLSANMNRYKESRSITVQDFFGDYLADANYVFNSSNDFMKQFGVTYGQPMGLPVSIGLSYAPLLTFDYKYNEEVHDASYDFNRDPLVGYHIMETGGQLNALSFGIGVGESSWFSVGVGIHKLFDTDITMRRAVIQILESDNLASDHNTDLKTTSPISGGMFYSASFLMNLNKSLQLGVGMETVLDLISDSTKLVLNEYDSTFTSTTDLNFQSQKPKKLRAGLRYQPRQQIPATLIFEYEKVDYSASLSDSTLLDVENYHFGFEYSVNGGLPVRVGLVFRSSPYFRTMKESIFTFGTGFSFGQITIDIAGEYGQVDYTAEDLFQPDNDISNPSGYENIHETQLNFTTSLRYAF